MNAQEGRSIRTSIDIKGDSLIVDVEGADKLWALKSRLEIPLTNIVSTGTAEAEAREWLHGIRLGGTHIPGVISAGRFYSHGKWVFWDVHDPAKAIGIELRDEHYSKLIIEADNPEDQIKCIREALPKAQLEVCGGPRPGQTPTAMVT